MLVLVTLGLAGCGGAAVKATPAATTPAAVATEASPNASPNASAEPPPGAAASAPAAGATLADSTQDGWLYAVANSAGQGFTIADYVIDGRGDKLELQAYDAAGDELAQMSSGFTAGCGVADLTNGKGRLLVTEDVTEKPAEGINPALYSLALTAADANTGATVWTAAIVTDTQDSLGCGNNDNLQGFTATSDGHYGLSGVAGQPDVSVAVDLTDGSLHPRKDLVGVLGNYLLRGSGQNQDENDKSPSLTLTIPDGWPALGHAAPVDTSGKSTPTGYLDPNQVGGQTSRVVTPDGFHLIGSYFGNDSDSGDHLAGYTLPSMKRSWRLNTPDGANDQLLAVSVTWSSWTAKSREGTATGCSRWIPVTGKQLWKINVNGGAVCAATASQLLVDVHEQLATLDVATGKQLSYAANIKHELLGDTDAGSRGCWATGWRASAPGWMARS